MGTHSLPIHVSSRLVTSFHVQIVDPVEVLELEHQ